VVINQKASMVGGGRKNKKRSGTEKRARKVMSDNVSAYAKNCCCIMRRMALQQQYLGEGRAEPKTAYAVLNDPKPKCYNFFATAKSTFWLRAQRGKRVLSFFKGERRVFERHLNLFLFWLGGVLNCE